MGAIGENKKKYDKEYIGKVVSLDDPEKLMRVRVSIDGLFDGEASELPLATYKFPIGSRAGDGNFCPVKVGDVVWIDFPMGGDTRYPRITGSVHYCPGGTPNLPSESFNGGEATRPRESWEPAPSSGTYHQDVIETLNGVTTTKRSDGSFSILQRSSGAEVYIHPDGQVVIHAASNISISASGDMKLFSTSKINLASPVVAIDSPAITLNGPITQGKGSNGGNFSIGGTLTADADVLANGISLHNHKHTDVQSGSSQTGTPV